MFSQKSVPWQIAVEGADDVVAISPDERLGTITFVAVGFGVSNQIQPVPGPVFSVVRGVQELFDECGPVLLSGAGGECFDLLRLGRQAGDIIGRPADQMPRVCGRVGCQSAVLQAGSDEGINFVVSPRRALRGQQACGQAGRTSAVLFRH